MNRPRKRTAPAETAAGAPEPRAPRLDLLDPRAPYLVPLLLLVLTRLVLWFRSPWASEDALITFRFAANWAHGLGPAYNAGEKVFGFTSPPWMAWVAAGIKLGADPIVWTRSTLLVADVATLLLGASLLERHASRASAWCFAFFFAVLTFFSGLMASGLEMGALIALVFVAATLLERRHPAAGVALGVLAIFRPEGLLAALVLSVWATWRDRAIAAGITAVTALALAAYYGSPIPQSLIAKATVYGTSVPWGAPQWWEWLLPLPFTPGTSEAGLLMWIYVLFSPAAFAGLVEMWPRRRTPLAGAIAALLIVWLALFASGASWFFWYFAAPLVAWAGLASVGLPTLTHRPHLYVAAALMLAGHWLQGGKLYVGRAETEAVRFGAVADLLQANARAGESVFLEPIGTIGWRNPDLRLIDEVGLVAPAIAKRRREGAGWYTDTIERERPQWLVIRGSMLRTLNAYAGVGDPFRSMEEGQRVLSTYALAAATDSLGNEATLVVLHRMADKP